MNDMIQELLSERDIAPPGKDTALQGLKEISDYARVSENTLCRYIREMAFPANKVGGQWFSDKTRVDAWRLKQIDAQEEE